MLTIASRLDVMNRLGRALADPTRSRMILTLLDHPAYPAELARDLDLTRPNVSNHLACLRDCGIVVSEPEGRRTRYEIADSHLAQALTALVDATLAVDEDAPCIDPACSLPRMRRSWGGRMILTSVLQAMGLFAATNIDDIIVLSLFFARGAGQRGTTARILAGQYLGFAGILGAAVLVTIGAGAFLPSAAIPYFGLIPLGLGLWAAWQAWRGDDDDDDDEAKVAGKKVGVWTVAGVTLANGGDNIGVYTPVFLSAEPLAVVAYCIVFLALVAVLVALAKFVATRPPIAEVLERWEHILFPIVLIGLGIVILVSGGAFGL